jgi:ABC-type uncharacterized transport system involved in gliding motility auxiliary subunit
LRVLRGYGTGAGILLLVLGFILSTMRPERQAVSLSIGGFGLLLLVSGLILNRERVTAVLTGRRGRAAGASAGYAITVVAVIVLINFLAGRHHARYDSTENKAFSLSEQTLKVLESLPRDVQVTAFFRDSEPTKGRLDDLVAEYRYHSSKLTWRYVDPDKNPGEVGRYEIQEYGTIVFESAGQETRITSSDEESLTNALIKVTRDRERVAYIATGHGERGMEDGDRDGLTLLKDSLEKQNYRVASLNLTQGVPGDASLLFIPGPRKPFLPEEIRMVDDYLDGGGRVMLLQDPGVDSGLTEVLGAYGLTIREDVIIDRVSQLFGGDARIPMVPGDGYDRFHQVTKHFHYQTFYPLATSIEIAASLPDGVSASSLAETSDVSWGEASEAELESGRPTFKEGEDTRGPMTVAAAASRRLEPAEDENDETARESSKEIGSDPETPESGPGTPEARLVLFGDSDFLTNAYFNASGNGDLALNAIAWLAEREELVSIRPKTSVPRLVILTPTQVFYYFWTIVAVLPITIAVIGVGIWIRRRKL